MPDTLPIARFRDAKGMPVSADKEAKRYVAPRRTGQHVIASNTRILADIGRGVLLDKSYGHCWYCGQKLTTKTVTMDHIVSRNSGGTSDWSNLVPCCRRCNTVKHDQSVERLREKLGLETFYFEDAALTP